MLTIAIAIASMVLLLIGLALRQLAPVPPGEAWPLRERRGNRAVLLEDIEDSLGLRTLVAPPVASMYEPMPRAISLTEFDVEAEPSPFRRPHPGPKEVRAVTVFPSYAQMVLVELGDENTRLLGTLRALAAEPTTNPPDDERNQWRYRARSALWYAERKQWDRARLAMGIES